MEERFGGLGGIALAANFCLQCGHALETREIGGARRRACPACDFVFWGDFSIGAGALVVRDHRILLVKRAQDPGRGLWTNPGGYCEQGELLHQTIEREVLEEAGVQARVNRVVALRDLPRQVHNIYVVFAMEYVAGEPTPDGVEVDEAGFFSPDEMADMNIANLTRWLVAIALADEGKGLVHDAHAEPPLRDYGLFRIAP